MKDAGHRACVEAALAHERTDRVPVNNFALVTAARSAGVKVETARWNPEISSQTAIDYAMKTGSDFVKPVLDSQIPFVDLGMNVRFPEDDYGSVRSHLVQTAEDVDGLAFFDPARASECPKFQAITGALAETSKRLEEDLHICGLSWGPITTAGYIMGVEDMLMMTFTDPDMVKKLVKRTAPFVADMQNSMLDAGATVMWMADPTSSEDILSPDMFAEYSLDSIADVVSSVRKDHKDAPTFVHICGNTLEIMDSLPGAGVDCFSFDHAVDIAKAKEVAGTRMSLMGNIDPVRMIMNGTPDGIRDECYRMVDIAGQEGGYVIAPGCETPISSPDENVLAMGLAGRDYWKQRS